MRDVAIGLLFFIVAAWASALMYRLREISQTLMDIKRQMNYSEEQRQREHRGA